MAADGELNTSMAVDEGNDTLMGDIVGANTNDTNGTGDAKGLEIPIFSDDELRVLALYDRLRELQLQIALLEAQRTADERAAEGTATDPTDSDIDSARDRLLDARAAYVLRNEVVDSVLTVHPVLRAVHETTRASPIERDLLPAIQRRDAAAQAIAKQLNTRRALLDEQATVAARRQRVRRQNEALAATLRSELAKADGADDEADKMDDDEDEELAQHQHDLKTSRQRWRLVKGTTSAIIAGSGVDWARDTELCELVLDPE